MPRNRVDTRYSIRDFRGIENSIFSFPNRMTYELYQSGVKNKDIGTLA